MPERKPKRIQRKRTRGWRMPDGAVYVGRPSIFGNPFVVGRDGDIHQCLAQYLGYINSIQVISDGSRVALPDPAACRFMNEVRKLRGKDLACWCPDGQPCHADILLEIANRT